MVKNILIITSNYTGHGHKSITEALIEQFSEYPDINIHVADGFELGGIIGLKIGKAYGSVTRNARELYRLIWDISIKNPNIIRDFTQIIIQDSFLKLLKKTVPDVIIAVHPSFVGSIINILEEHNIKIPLVSIVADLVSISPLWADPRAYCTICPTVEAMRKCIEFGVPSSKILVTGFPVRRKFCESGTGNEPDIYHSSERPLECLIMSGGEGSGNLGRLAKILLKNFDCHVKIVAGRNVLLKKRLERTLKEKSPDSIEIYGFIENVQDLMRSSDIAFTRGSPNVMMEAVHCNVPLVVTGALPGQEEGNPEYLLKYNLGVVCKDLRKLRSTVTELLANDALKLRQIKKAQIEYRNPDAAKNIVDFILGIENDEYGYVPGQLEKLRLSDKSNDFIFKKTNELIFKKIRIKPEMLKAKSLSAGKQKRRQ